MALIDRMSNPSHNRQHEFRVANRCVRVCMFSSLYTHARVERTKDEKRDVEGGRGREIEGSAQNRWLAMRRA